MPIIKRQENSTTPGQQRQRQRHQTQGLMNRIMAAQVHNKSLNISLPTRTQKQREVTNFSVSTYFGERDLWRLIFRICN